MILRNLSDNANLVNGILRAHKQFEDLGTFTLARGLREIRRAQAAKDDRSRQEGGVDKGKKRAENEEKGVEDDGDNKKDEGSDDSDPLSEINGVKPKRVLADEEVVEVGSKTRYVLLQAFVFVVTLQLIIEL